MKWTFALAFSAVLYANSAAASVQSQVDALSASVGGEIRLGCGTFTEAQIQLRNDVAIVGSGPCTVIPAIKATGTTAQPKVRIRVENLIIDGTLDGGEYIGIDFRHVRLARIRNVQIRNVQYGVVLDGSSQNNSVIDTIIDATTMCYEMVSLGEVGSNGLPTYQDTPNENLIQGGRCQYKYAPQTGSSIGIWIRNANNTKIFGVAFENLSVGIKLDTGAVGTTIIGPRLENIGIGIKLKTGSLKTAILNPYDSSVGGVAFSSDSGATYYAPPPLVVTP